MDVFLYRLNISGLAISTVMIAMFFLVLARSIRRAEMRWWTYGWLANAAALLITTAFWYAERPTSLHGLLTIRFSYGVGQLAPGGNPDEALKAADEAMYRAKPS